MCDSVNPGSHHREWMSHWQKWRNNVAWRHTWLSLKMSTIEHQLANGPLSEDDKDVKIKRPYRKKRTSPTQTETGQGPSLYVPAVNTLGDHPFLSLQMPSK